MLTNDKRLDVKILIIDDQKLHSSFLEKVLAQEGYTNIRCVNDPLKALSAIHDFEPDAVILDLIMPQVDGFQILEKLNEFRKGHYLPILALSSERSADIRLRALQSGATDFLNKPFENPELLIRLRNIIEMRLLHLQVEEHNRNLEGKVLERTQELRESQLDIIRRLAQAAEFRDNDTGLHIIRMSQYCAKFSEILGMSREEAELILNAAPLHDVGKIGIPDSILLKPGKLTVEEFEIMKTHTTIGGKLLSRGQSPVMKMAREIALTHHEKWDGSGYPNQLKGDSIPLVGQICSVCDVFDALTSQRPYKEAWTVEEAAAEMKRMKEGHFNPSLADAFLEALPEFVKIKEKYAENGRE